MQSGHADKVLQDTLAAIFVLQNELVPAHELKRAARYATGILRVAVSSQQGLADKAAALAVHGLGLEHLNRREEDLLAVSSHQVREVARRYMAPAATTAVLVH
jgi:zinc protease